MHRTTFTTLAAGIAAAVVCTGAGAAMMHPELGAKLSGMGESGIVNLTANTQTKKLCWTFDLPMVAATGASIRDAAGMRIATLGSMYAAKGCTSSSAMVLDELETKPAAYRVWVDTKNHSGDLRGTLFAGMTAMKHA